DHANDWSYGEALWSAAGGTPTLCANALSIANYAQGTCAYSLFSDRTATDFKFSLDNALADGKHEFRWGGLLDVSHVAKDYSITLQPGNFLAPIHAPLMPNAPFTVADTAPNDGRTE